MSQVIDLKQRRLLLMVKRGYRNWSSHFKENFGLETRLSQLSLKTLSFLAQGREKGTFYLYDLIMNLKNLGSGFEFSELNPKEKMIVIDHYLFMLDRMRFECMKRLKWLESYPGQDFTLVELIINYDNSAPNLQADIPILSPEYPGYDEFSQMNTFDKEVFVRKLIPKALEAIQKLSGN